jgi:pimeloyl-ACP methyl ester carboxylesterase
MGSPGQCVGGRRGIITRVSATIYRSVAGRDSVRQWCESQLDAWPVEHQRDVLHAEGCDTHLVQAGAGPLSVVFVAGDRFSTAACLPLLTVLARRYRIIAADVPGQPGLSSDVAPHADGRLTGYGSWLDRVVEGATTGPVVVLGHSFGGAVVLAAGSPRIHGKVAVSTGGLCSVRLTPGILLAFAAWMARPGPTSSGRLLRALSAPGSSVRSELVDWMTLVARHTRPVSSSDIVSTASAGPVVVATGQHDRLISPQRLRPAAHRILNADVRVIPAAGHLVTEESPEQMVELIATLAA